MDRGVWGTFGYKISIANKTIKNNDIPQDYQDWTNFRLIHFAGSDRFRAKLVQP